MLIDTDIIIWSLRGEDSATDYIDSLEDIQISDVTYMELVQGTLRKKEFRNLKKTLDYIGSERISITSDVSQKAVDLVETYAHSHSMQMGDALIAATAIIHNLPFSSGNKKHFDYISDLEFFAFRKSP